MKLHSDPDKPLAVSYERKDERRGFLCAMCGKSFQRRGNLNIHYKAMHTTAMFTCEICGLELARFQSLVRHKRSHCNPHSPLNIPNDTPWNCPICSEKCLSQSGLKTHQNLHLGTYKCNICLKNFSRKAGLDRHMDTHSVTRQYACKLCDWKFKQKDTYHKHLKNVYKKTPCLNSLHDHVS